MFRRFFKIGFGGCGCALEEHFRKHAVNLTCDLLKTHYLKDLKGWKNGLPLDHKFGIVHTVDRLDSILNEELTDRTFNEKLDEIAAELRSWQVFSKIVEKTGKPYEDVILEDIRDIVKTMEKEVDDTKYKGKILFESLPVDSFTETEAKGKSERFYVYNQNITETRELIVDQFGQVVIESQGFNHQPELQMLPFSIKEVRDEVFKKITSTIETRRLKDSATGGYLFFVGLGGGTGTGVISPLAEKFGKGSLGYFTVAVLGGEADDKVLQSQKPWFRRCFNMLIALNDLIVTAELDGIILVDNDVIMSPEEKKGKSGPDLMAEIDEKIIEKLYPAFGITVLDGNDLDWSQLKEPIGLDRLKKNPPVIVPCYASGDCSKSEDNLKPLIDEALEDKKDSNNGKLARCEHLEKAERVFVYVRCIKDEKTLRKKLADKFAPNNLSAKELKKFETDKIAILKDYLFCWDDVKKGNYEELKSSLRNVCEIDWVDNAEPKGDHNGDKLELCNHDNKNEKIIIEIRERELFNWDDVLQKNDSEFKKYLKTRNIEVDSISMPDDKTITISKNEKKVATITLNTEENNATLEWANKGNKEKWELKVKKEKDKRKIYTPQEAELFTGKYLFNWDDVVRKKQNLEELKEYLEDCKIEFDLTSMPNDKTITISKNEKKVATITLNEEENKATCDWDKENELKVKDRRIYDYLRKNGNKKVEYPELKVETVKGKRYVYLKKGQATRTWIKNNLKKDIVVFESQEIGSFWHEREKKKNEVLILLFNPDVKEALSDRLLEAKKFVDLLVRFKEVIEDKAKDGSKDKSDIAGQIIGQINKGQTVDANLNEKLKAIKLKEGIEENDKPLPQAKDFLFPKELYDKDNEIYDRMVEILDRLKSEAGKIPEEGKDEDWWPIFIENIFNLISTSGKRDEVILSAIEALEDQNKFNRLVGEEVYNTYFETFKRQYFKYNARYLYHPGVGEPILSDDAEEELPVALKEELDKQKKERVVGAKLKGLVNKHTSVMSGHAGTTDGTELSYPAMLAVAGLYAEWEQVGSWKFENNNFVLDGSNDKIIEKLFKTENAPTSGDFKIYVFSKEIIERDILDKHNLLIIDADGEDATLVIREANKDFFPQVDEDEVPKLSIPQELVDMFKESGIEYVNNKNYEVKDRKLEPRPEAITNNKLYCCYYIRANDENYSIDGDRIYNTLKVKKEEGNDAKTLKIYKKRGEYFKAAKAEG